VGNKFSLLAKKFEQILDKEAAYLSQIQQKLLNEEKRFGQLLAYESEYLSKLDYFQTQNTYGQEVRNYYLFLEHIATIKRQQSNTIQSLKDMRDKSQLKFNKAFHKNKSFKEYLRQIHAAERLGRAHREQKLSDMQVNDWYNNLIND